jgi:hypothetical protein
MPSTSKTAVLKPPSNRLSEERWKNLTVHSAASAWLYALSELFMRNRL